MNKGKIVGKGFNSTKTHSGLAKQYGYYSNHAETMAMRASDGCGDTLVVARIRNDGEVSCAKPCPLCMSQMRDKGIKKVYYTMWDGSIQMMRVK